MIVTERKNLRIVIPAELKERWEALTDKKKISQQEAIEALVRFLLAQEDVAQSVILGQLDATPQVLELIFKSMGKKPPGDPRMRIAAKPMGPDSPKR